MYMYVCVCVCVCVGGGGGGGIQFAVVWVVSNTYDCSLCYFRRWLKVCEGRCFITDLRTMKYISYCFCDLFSQYKHISTRVALNSVVACIQLQLRKIL